MKIAIVHDALCVPGGAERLVLRMAEAFPGAPIYTSVYLPNNTFPEYQQHDVRPFALSEFIHSETQFKSTYLLWLAMMSRMTFRNYDLVLSSATYLAKFIRPVAGTRHVGYLHAPYRYLWKTNSYSRDSLPWLGRLGPINRWILPMLQSWDRKHTRNIDHIVTTCHNMAAEIDRIYGCQPSVINPPVPLADFPLAQEPGRYFLSVSRLISHKRVDVAIEACNRLQEQLVVVGDGPEKGALQRMAGPSIHFAGRVSDQELVELYRGAKALLFPSHEDYGLTPLEAQACGRPVIAFGQGGVLETVKPPETGIFFPSQTAAALIYAIEQFYQHDFSPSQIRQWATKFDVPSFITALRGVAEATGGGNHAT